MSVGGRTKSTLAKLSTLPGKIHALELELPRCRAVDSAWISSRLMLLGKSIVHGRRGACDAGAGGGQGGLMGTFEVLR